MPQLGRKASLLRSSTCFLLEIKRVSLKHLGDDLRANLVGSAFTLCSPFAVVKPRRVSHPYATNRWSLDTDPKIQCGIVGDKRQPQEASFQLLHKPVQYLYCKIFSLLSHFVAAQFRIIDLATAVEEVLLLFVTHNIILTRIQCFSNSRYFLGISWQ